jgi:hypothetical protein
MTAFLTSLPILASEISFILVKTIEEISGSQQRHLVFGLRGLPWGWNCFFSPWYSTSMTGEPSLSTTVKGQCCVVSSVTTTKNLETDLHVLLDIGIVKSPSNQTLGVEDGVCGVHGS